VSALAIAVSSSFANWSMRSGLSAGGDLWPVQYTTAMPQSRPSTTIGAPTLERTPSSRMSSVKEASGASAYSIRAGRPVRRTLAVTLSPSTVKRAPIGSCQPSNPRWAMTVIASPGS
jgi:hypothetical protein